MLEYSRMTLAMLNLPRAWDLILSVAGPGDLPEGRSKETVVVWPVGSICWEAAGAARELVRGEHASLHTDPHLRPNCEGEM